ncbi:MAG: hypothetical protein LQ337_008003 [Flavoplaca oasis]|nr:MAG: hypothetical protein LQ337_008003 [Flavoplaca oasis]
MSFDPLDELLELEDTFYKEGYDLGIQDGNRTGRIEGRLFGLTSAFEKFSVMGSLHGRSVIWSATLSGPQLPSESQDSANDRGALATDGHPTDSPKSSNQEAAPPDASSLKSQTSPLPQTRHMSRLERHVRTLYALTEPASLATENTEEAVSDFNDRLRRAEGKAKVVEKFFGQESSSHDSRHPDGDMEMDFTSGHQKVSKGNSGIEDHDTLL